MKALSTAGTLGLTRFIAYQGFYSLAARELERDILPALRSEGLGLLVYSPLAGGWLVGASAGRNRRPQNHLPPVDEVRADAVRTELAHLGPHAQIYVEPKSARLVLPGAMQRSTR